MRDPAQATATREFTAALLDENRVTIKVKAAPLAISLDHTVPLGMVVNELITNATKYAYPAPRTGVISVRFGPAGKGVLLSIGDAGRGIPESAVRNSSGLGMGLVGLARASGRGDVVPEAGRGREVRHTVATQPRPTKGRSSSRAKRTKLPLPPRPGGRPSPGHPWVQVVQKLSAGLWARAPARALILGAL